MKAGALRKTRAVAKPVLIWAPLPPARTLLSPFAEGQAALHICPPQPLSVPALEASAPKSWPGTGQLLTPTSAARSLQPPQALSPACVFYPPSFFP